jgi:hypothetical protein
MRRSFNQRIRKGTSLIELCAGLLITVPIFLLLFDCATFIVCIQINDETCREAARVAAGGAPSTAELRARSIVLKANENKIGMIADLRLVSVISTLSPASMTAVQRDGGTVSGTVTVTTAADTYPFFGCWILLGKKFLTFQSVKSCPYTGILSSAMPAS